MNTKDETKGLNALSYKGRTIQLMEVTNGTYALVYIPNSIKCLYVTEKPMTRLEAMTRAKAWVDSNK